jgi:ribosomal protein S19E (S16A)
MAEHELLWHASARSQRLAISQCGASTRKILAGLQDRGIVASDGHGYAITAAGREAYDAAEAARLAFMDSEMRKFLGGG